LILQEEIATQSSRRGRIRFIERIKVIWLFSKNS